MSNHRTFRLSHFFKMEAAGGVLLMLATVLALICANTPLYQYYALLLDTPLEIRIGALEIAKPLLLWINDGLMAIFFFLIGLELKREFLEGELGDLRSVMLPIIGAAGGMIVPALIYLYFNADDEVAIKGWAIPAATDIAFALGVLSLLGSRVPTSLKLFVASLAIFDDIGAIVIIALFYTEQISMLSLTVVGCCIPVLFLFHHFRLSSKGLYVLIGVVMWSAMLKSGVHATLTGVILSIFVPMKSSNSVVHSPVRSMEHDLQPVVAFVILPLFAFANAGIHFDGVGAYQMLHSVPMGIFCGLFIGKQVGVMGFCWLGVKAGLVKLPQGVGWLTMYGTAMLCGIGFTMSLFIGSLAFGGSDLVLIFDERLGILAGSFASGVVGYLVLRFSLSQRPDG